MLRSNEHSLLNNNKKVKSNSGSIYWQQWSLLLCTNRVNLNICTVQCHISQRLIGWLVISNEPQTLLQAALSQTIYLGSKETLCITGWLPCGYENWHWLHSALRSAVQKLCSDRTRIHSTPNVAARTQWGKNKKRGARITENFRRNWPQKRFSAVVWRITKSG